MIRIKKNLLYKLYPHLSKKIKTQFYFLILLFIINGIFESFSIAAVIPFISIITLQNDLSTIPFLGEFLIFFGINDIANSLFLITFLFSFFVIISTFLRMFNLKYTYKITANLEIELCKKIFERNISQSYINYTKSNSSHLISIALEKVTQTANTLSTFLMLLSSLILSIFILLSLLFISWKIVLIGVCFLLFYYLIVYKKVNSILYKNGKILASISPKRIKILQEVFVGFRDVVVNGTEKVYVEMFNRIDSEYKIKVANTKFLSLFPRYLIEGIVILILVISGYHISFLNFNLIALLPIFVSFIYSFQKLLPLVQQIYSTLANYKAKSVVINEVIHELEKNKIENFREISIKNLNFKNDIFLKDLFFAYENDKFIIKDVNFRINKGEHIGIYGETGSGKSTFLDILIGLLPPTKGQFFIDDEDIYNKNFNYQWTKKIAHVSQNIFLKDGSIAENIAYGEKLNDIDFKLLVKVSKIACIYNFIKKNDQGFKTQVGERGIRLSGGQRQRIAIARALYKSREILVLDEATSALDDKTEELIIESLKRDKKLTIIMVTHRLKSLRICDRVFKVYKNKLIEEKNH